MGRGHACLYGPSNVPLEEGRGRFEEALDILGLAWTRERFSYRGLDYRADDVSVVPKPLQWPQPRLLTCAVGAGRVVVNELRRRQDGGRIGAAKPAPHGRRDSNTGHAFVEEEHGVIYQGTRPRPAERGGSGVAQTT
jgi:hypothetical protein